MKKKKMERPAVIGTNLIMCAATPSAPVFAGVFLAIKIGGTAAVMAFCNIPAIGVTLSVGYFG